MASSGLVHMQFEKPYVCRSDIENRIFLFLLSLFRLLYLHSLLSRRKVSVYNFVIVHMDRVIHVLVVCERHATNLD